MFFLTNFLEKSIDHECIHRRTCAYATARKTIAKATKTYSELSRTIPVHKHIKDKGS